MGRRKKEPGEGATYLTFGAYKEELDAVEWVMDRWRVSQSAAIRLLVTTGYRRLRTGPTDPLEEGPHDE